METVKLVKDAVKFNPHVSESALMGKNLGIVYAMMFRSQPG